MGTSSMSYAMRDQHWEGRSRHPGSTRATGGISSDRPQSLIVHHDDWGRDSGPRRRVSASAARAVLDLSEHRLLMSRILGAVMRCGSRFHHDQLPTIQYCFVICH